MKFTKETLRRTARTFLQAFVGAIVGLLPTVDFTESKDVLKGAIITLIVSGTSAGLSAIMNLEEGEELC